jgi:hypothetical protein
MMDLMLSEVDSHPMSSGDAVKEALSTKPLGVMDELDVETALGLATNTQIMTEMGTRLRNHQDLLRDMRVALMIEEEAEREQAEREQTEDNDMQMENEGYVSPEDDDQLKTMH